MVLCAVLDEGDQEVPQLLGCEKLGIQPDQAVTAVDPAPKDALAFAVVDRVERTHVFESERRVDGPHVGHPAPPRRAASKSGPGPWKICPAEGPSGRRRSAWPSGSGAARPAPPAMSRRGAGAVERGGVTRPG